jgi:transcriptional activator of cad operon
MAVLRFGEFVLDGAAFALHRDGVAVRLQPKTFDVLAYLVANPGRVVRDDLVAAVWPGVIVTDHSLTRCIKDLRKALGDDASSPRYIETVARRGYRFLPTPEAAGVEAVPEAAAAGAVPDRPPPRASRLHIAAFFAFAAILGVAGVAVSLARDASAPGTTRNLDAIQAFEIGQELMRRRPSDWHSQARAAFDRAIAHDPRFAAAHAGRANVLAVEAPDGVRQGETFRQAHESVARALALDPGSALAHAALGYLRLHAGDARGAEQALRRATGADPTLGNAWNWLGTALGRQGRFEESLAAREAGIRADPLHPSLLANVGIYYAARGRYAEARESYARMLDLPQRPPAAQISLVDLALAQGRLAEALAHSLRWEARAEAAGERRGAKLWTTVVLARLGFADEVRARLQVLMDEGLTSGSLATIDRLLDSLGASAEFPALAARLVAPGEQAYWLEAMLARSQVLSGDPGGIERLASALLRDGMPLAFGGWGDNKRRLDQSLALAYGLQRVGRAAEAREQLDRLLDDHARAGAHGLGRTADERMLHAMALALSGQRDEALRALERAVDLGWSENVRAEHDPRWDVLRGEPRFQASLARAREAVERERGPAQALLAAAAAPK